MTRPAKASAMVAPFRIVIRSRPMRTATAATMKGAV